jgi:hypothetical protein
VAPPAQCDHHQGEDHEADDDTAVEVHHGDPLSRWGRNELEPTI